MNTRSQKLLFALLVLSLLSSLTPQLSTSYAQGTAFTYQGRLNLNGSQAGGSYDMSFSLYATNQAGSAIAGPVTNVAVAVSNGLFTTTVDFGNAFNGASNWLQIAVSTNSANAFSALTPRQRLTPVPYSLYSSSAGYAATAQLAAGLPPGSITTGMLSPGVVSVLGTPNDLDTNAVVVNNSGLVGIGTGTNTPAAGLQINTSSAETVLPVLFEVENNTAGYTNLYSPWQAVANNNLLAISANGGVSLMNIANPSSPVILSQIVNGTGTFTNINGATGMSWVGSNLVVAANGSSALDIISFTNPSSPVKIAELRNGFGGWNYLSGAIATAVSGNLLAVAAYNSSAVTLADISNPSSPLLRSTMVNGSFGFTNLGAAVSLALSGNLLVVGAYSSNAVTLVNVTDPANPQKLAELRNGVGGFTNLNGVYSVALSGNLLAIAAAYSSAVTLVDVSNPANPVKLAELRDGVGGYSLNTTWWVTLSGNRLAIGGTGAGSTVTLVDVSNPSSPVLLATATAGINGADYLLSPIGMAFAGTNLVACANNSPGYVIFGIGNQAVGFDSANWVGIGTTHPQAALDVVGNVIVENANLFDVSATRLALGSSANADGTFSTALGASAAATGPESSALGYTSFAGSSYATAVGAYAIASGYEANALGYNTTASGSDASAIGFSSTASGYQSVALGYGDIASSSYSAAMGYDCTASSNNCTAVGDNATASGSAATALGYYANASGYYSTAVGVNVSASGQNSTALGSATRAAANNSFVGGNSAYATNTGAILLADISSFNNFYSTNNNEFAVRSVGGVRFVTATDVSGNPTAGVHLFPGGSAWATISDQNAKKNFAPVNGQEVLNKLTTVPVEQWNYKWEKDSDTPNIGPMAQAFKAAFYPGRDEKSITTLEFDGVELAAIQGLNQKLGEKDTEIKELKSELNDLKALVNKLAQSQGK